jgi:tetratricopeptide (TPR) repeat protein
MLRALRLLPLFALLFAATVASAQSARWEPAGGTLGRDQTSTLALIFDNAAPDETPALPAVPGLEFIGPPGRSEQTSINLGTGARTVRQRTVTYTYRVRPTRTEDQIRIPAFTVPTDAGPLIVPAVGFTLAETTVGGTGLTLDQIANTRFTPPAAPVWAGEVFRLTHTLDVERRYVTNDILAGPLDWAPTPLIAEDWSRPTGTETTRDSQPRYLVTWQTRAIAPAASPALAVPSATQLVNLPTGTANSFFLGQAMFEQFTLNTPSVPLAVRPLPLPAPNDFDGAVGQFTLASKIVPEKAAVGEPVTWTLTLDGTGNWPLIDRLPARELPAAFRVVSPRAQKTPKNNALFDATLAEDLVLIPQKPGRYTLGPYTLSIFNPSTGAYQTLRTDPVTIEITGPAAAAATETPNPESPTPTDNSDPRTPLPPAKIAPLPADPLPPGLVASAPFATWPAPLCLTLVALGIPVVLWLILAARHARRHDPLRDRREAHARLSALLPRLQTHPTDAHLLAWQQTTRELFALESVTPSATDLPDPVWAALWLETERVLYRPATRLSADWHAQAADALRRATPPPRSFLAALRPAHLLARAALWILLFHSAFIMSPSSFAAESPDPAMLYARADFPAAEAAWRDALDASPRDAALRHNLALALAQQGRWDESAAHAYAAALHAPSDPALRRLLDATLPRATYAPPAIPDLARRLAVHEWQLLALAAALVLLTLVPIAYLFARFSRGPFGSASFFIGHLSLVVAVAALVASLLALRAHGPAIAPEAVLVWKADTLRAVPTELGEQKVTTDLPAGTLARVDKDFLGWRRLVLRDGNTGWVRAESLVRLWQAP